MSPPPGPTSTNPSKTCTRVDRKSTRLNSSHLVISYAVFCLKKNKYAFLQITRRRFLSEWEALKKVISRRNIRRRITIPLTLSNLKLIRQITRTENILHRNFNRRQVAIQNRVSSNIGIIQSTFSVKLLYFFFLSSRPPTKPNPLPRPTPFPN